MTRLADGRPPVHDGPTASNVTASDRKTRRRLHRRSPSSIESCIPAHETVDDKPTPAFFHVVELGGPERTGGRLSDTLTANQGRRPSPVASAPSIPATF